MNGKFKARRTRKELGEMLLVSADVRLIRERQKFTKSKPKNPIPASLAALIALGPAAIVVGIGLAFIAPIRHPSPLLSQSTAGEIPPGGTIIIEGNNYSYDWFDPSWTHTMEGTASAQPLWQISPFGKLWRERDLMGRYL